MRLVRHPLALPLVAALLALPGVAALPSLHAPDAQALPAHPPVALPAAPVAAPTADAPAPAAPAAAAPGSYAIEFHCPDPANAALAPAQNKRCPMDVFDAEDVLSQPVLLVDPKNPDYVAFNAMHGGHGVPAPTGPPLPDAAARDNLVHQPHTTWYSANGGAQWSDNPYYASPGLGGAPGAAVYGIDNAAILDEHGHAVLSSLYAYRNDTNAPLQYAMVNRMADRVNRPVDYANNYVRLDARHPGEAIPKVFLASDPRSHQVAAFWLAVDANRTGFIDLAHARTTGGSAWGRVAASQRIGPCTDMSNPLGVNGRVFVGCFAAPGLAEKGANITRGSLQMYAFDPATWNRTYIGPAPFSAPSNAVLASAEELKAGAMVLAGGGLDREGRPTIRVAFGGEGAHWTNPADYSRDISDPVAYATYGSPIEERVNAVAFAARDSTVHLITMERYRATGSGLEAQVPYTKEYAVVHATGRFLGKFALAYGDPQSAPSYDPRVKGLGDDVFDDQHDSIVVVPTKSGDRLFTGFGDHGLVRFAEVVEDNPPPGGFFPYSPVVPIPTPLPAANPAMVGAVAGALSTSLLAALAAARNKKAAEVTA